MAKVKYLQFVLVTLIIFLQSGFSYWISFQALAFLIISLIIYLNKAKFFVNLRIFIPLFLYVLFCIDLYFHRSFIYGDMISNKFLSTFRIIFFSSYIYLIFFIKFKNLFLLKFARKIYKFLLILLPTLILISESRIISFFSTESLKIQNASLIINSTDLEQIRSSISATSRGEGTLRPDLFYGEPSYLALVVFCIFSGYIFLSYVNACNSYLKRPELSIYSSDNLIFAGLTIISLLITKSLSGVLYSLLIIFLFTLVRVFYKKSISLKLLLVFGITTAFAIITLISNQSLINRLAFTNLEESLSFYQRISQYSQWTFQDYFLGLQSSTKLGEFGFNNGFYFGIAIGGAGFIIYFLTLLKRIFFLSESILFGIYASFLLIAIFMQNGAIFAPDKSVIIFLTFLPFFNKRKKLK